VHLRRALLLFALVLGLTALATAIAPTRQPADQAPVVAPPSAGTPVPPPTTITMHAPPSAARSYAVAHDARVLLGVVAAEGGQAEIPKLGQTQAVGQGATAQFDLIDLAPGRYDVLFAPALAAPVKIGTLVSR
jgi:hypothetical protein